MKKSFIYLRIEIIFVRKAFHSVAHNKALGVALIAQWGKPVLGLLGEYEFYLQMKKKSFSSRRLCTRVCGSKQSLDDAPVQESLMHKIAIKFIQKEYFYTKSFSNDS